MGKSYLLRIVGAGPSGLTAAIVAAKAGRKVVIAERRQTVGARFRDDFQGLENWTSQVDVLDEFRALGIEPTFETTPVFEQTCFGPSGRTHRFQSRTPFYYLIRRGPGPGTLDTALLDQALKLGVSVHFGETIRAPTPPMLVGSGPRRADAIVVGIVFETEMANGYYACLNESLAPGGYGYLLVNGHRATLATCMFGDFHRAQHYLRRTLEFFQQRLSFDMKNVRTCGGIGNVFVPVAGSSESCLLIGEASGAQDALWGFGIRVAVRSAVLAVSGDRYDERTYRRAWEGQLGRQIRASLVNRFCINLAGDWGYRWLLWRLEHGRDPLRYMRLVYSPRPWKLGLFPIVRILAARRSKAERNNQSTKEI
jgi:flavin-dependent dehydrogenase